MFGRALGTLVQVHDGLEWLEHLGKDTLLGRKRYSSMRLAWSWETMTPLERADLASDLLLVEDQADRAVAALIRQRLIERGVRLYCAAQAAALWARARSALKQAWPETSEARQTFESTCDRFMAAFRLAGQCLSSERAGIRKRTMSSPDHVLVRIIVEQPRRERYRLCFDPDTASFVRTVYPALLYERGFVGCYGWIEGTGLPPQPHWDVYVCTDADPQPGERIDAALCGVFVRADGDHKFVALGPDLMAAGIQPELAALPDRRLANVYALYPVVGPDEGWRGAAFAADLVRTTPTHG